MKRLGVAFFALFFGVCEVLSEAPCSSTASSTGPLHVKVLNVSEEPYVLPPTHGDARYGLVSDQGLAEYEGVLRRAEPFSSQKRKESAVAGPTLLAARRRTQMVSTPSHAVDPLGASYMIPIRYWVPDSETYRTVHVRVTPSETVNVVARRAAKLTRGAIPLQKAMLYLSDEHLPLHKHFLSYYNAIRNGGLVELDYTWRPNGKPRSPFISADAI